MMKKFSSHTSQLISLLIHCSHNVFSPSMFVRTSTDYFSLYLQEALGSGENQIFCYRRWCRRIKFSVMREYIQFIQEWDNRHGYHFLKSTHVSRNHLLILKMTYPTSFYMFKLHFRSDKQSSFTEGQYSYFYLTLLILEHLGLSFFFCFYLDSEL